MSDYLNDPIFWKIYHSGDEEWPGYKALSKSFPSLQACFSISLYNVFIISWYKDFTDSKNASLPLLISEIYRLIPYIGSEYVQFHPKNMPEVKIEKIEIVGIVTEKLRMAKYTSYTGKVFWLVESLRSQSDLYIMKIVSQFYFFQTM